MTSIDLTASKEDIDAILKLAEHFHGIEEISEPINLDASRALDVGIPHVDPYTALTFVTLVFNGGTAVLKFLQILRDELKRHGGKIAVSDSQSGKALGQIGSGTSDEDVKKLAGH